MPVDLTNPDWKEPPLTLLVPREPWPFFRAVRSDPPTRDDFLADFEVRARFPSENHCLYRGFSVWDEEGIARDSARISNERLAEQDEPLFTHLTQVVTWPRGRHACAWIGPEEEHWCIWGPADDFLVHSRTMRVFPI